MSKQLQLVSWYKPNFGVSSIHLARLKTDQRAFVINGLESEHLPWKKLTELGYKPSLDEKFLFKIYNQDEKQQVKADLFGAFPKMAVANFFKANVYLSEDQFKEISSEVRKNEFIGMNDQGCEVYETAGSRYVIDRDGKQINESSVAVENPSFFLRMNGKDDDFAAIADGFTKRMALGTAMRPLDLRKLLNTVRGQAGACTEDDPQLRTLQEAVEASMQRRVHNEFKSQFNTGGVDKDSFNFSLKLMLNAPTAIFRTGSSVVNAQYSTPLPMSLAVQRIIGDTAGKTVLEPTIGNGSLVMGLPEGTSIIAYEIDPKRVKQVAQLRPDIKVKHTDTTREIIDRSVPIDVIVSNPPFGALDNAVQFDGLKVTRLDYLIAIKSLAARADKGVGAFILGADRQNMFAEKAGELHGSSHSFFKYVSDYYEILAVVELSGQMYAKQGAGYPTRLLVVGDRRTPEDTMARSKLPSWEINGKEIAFKSKSFSLPVCYSYDDLWEQAEVFRHLVESSLQKDAKSDSNPENQNIADLVGEQEQSAVAGAGTIPNDPPYVEETGNHDQASQAGLSTSQSPVEQGDTTTSGTAPVLSAEEMQAQIDARIKKNELALNQYQRPYIAHSSGTSSSMIPANLQAAVDFAMDRYKNKTGCSVDDFVKERCQLDDNDFSYLMPEQKDAIFLAINKQDEGDGFILGDQTGRGKGATQAAVIRAALLAKKTVIFLSEKENLFTDICRDLCAINSWDLVKPLVMNNPCQILNPEREVVARAEKPADLKRIMDRFLAGESASELGFNMVFATYSQFGRIGSSKASFIQAVAEKNCGLFLDEAHNAAGESNTFLICDSLVRAADSVVYSSATYSKNPKTMTVYRRAFPDSVNMDNLGATLVAGGETLMEIMSERLAQNGSYIRRESDTSRLVRETVFDKDNFERNVKFNDLHCKILRAMSYLSGDIEDDLLAPIKKQIKDQKEEQVEENKSMTNGELKNISEDQRKGQRMGVQYSNFGSRLYNLTQQFMLTIKVDPAIRMNIEDIENGRAPVNFIVNTNESALNEFFARSDKPTSEIQPESVEPESADMDLFAGLESELEGELEQEEASIAQEQSAEEPLFSDPDMYPLYSYADLLERMLDRLCMITTTDFRGNVTVEDARNMFIEGVDVEEMEELHNNFKNNIEKIRSMIKELPYFPISPIDAINQAIEEYQPKSMGDRFKFQTAEVSGRKTKFRVVYDANGKPVAMKRFKNELNRNHEINRFNDGDADVINITLAGSTGCSLHSSKTFKRQDQRTFNELQIATDPNKRAQGRGRVNRAGQVNDPIIRSFVTGLVAEDRLLAMANAKDRAQSAMTQSNRRNQFEIEEVPDILNSFGEKVVKTTMEARPDLCSILGITSQDFDEESQHSTQDNWFINRVFSRLGLLEDHIARELTDTIYKDYNKRLQELLAIGESPFKQRILDVKARLVSQKVLQGIERDEYVSSFDEPVYLTKYEWDVAVQPMRWNSVEAAIERSRLALEKEYGITAKRSYSWSQETLDLDQLYQKLNALIDVKMQAAKPKAFATVSDALSASEENIVKKLQKRKEDIIRLMRFTYPGNVVSYTDSIYGTISAVICKVRIPEEDSLHILGEYEVSLIAPGKDRPITMSLYSLNEDKNYEKNEVLSTASARSGLEQQFESAPEGTIVRSHLFLTGNLFKAVEMASTKSIGKTVQVEEADGSIKRAVMLRSDVSEENLLNMPIELQKPFHVRRFVDFKFGQPDTSSVLLSTRQFIRNQLRKDESIDVSLTLLISNDRKYTLSMPGTKDRSGSLLKDDHLKALFGQGLDFSGSRTAMSITSSGGDCAHFMSVIEHLYRNHKIVFKTDGCDYEAVNKIVSEPISEEEKVQMELERDCNSENTFA